MKKLTKLLLGFSVLAVLMVCMTTVSFAGTAEDKVTVSFRAAYPDMFEVLYDDLEVKGDLVETYFPEYAGYEPDGVSYLDAVVAATLRKYGDTGSISLSDYGYAWINTAFSGSVLGATDNDISVPSVHNNILDGDDLACLVYADGDWSRLYGFFDYYDYYAEPGETIQALVTGLSIMSNNIYIPDSAVLGIVDPSTGTITPFEGAAFENGVLTFAFDEVGTYYITALAKKTYSDDYGTYENEDVYGALAKVVIEKPVKPAKPVIKSAKRNTKTKATVSWKKANNAKKYKVEYRVKGTKKWSTKNAGNKLKVTLKLKAKKAYEVRVCAINGSKKTYSNKKVIKKK